MTGTISETGTHPQDIRFRQRFRTRAKEKARFALILVCVISLGMVINTSTDCIYEMNQLVRLAGNITIRSNRVVNFIGLTKKLNVLQSIGN